MLLEEVIDDLGEELVGDKFGVFLIGDDDGGAAFGAGVDVEGVGLFVDVLTGSGWGAFGNTAGEEGHELGDAVKALVTVVQYTMIAPPSTPPFAATGIIYLDLVKKEKELRSLAEHISCAGLESLRKIYCFDSVASVLQSSWRSPPVSTVWIDQGWLEDGHTPM